MCWAPIPSVTMPAAVWCPSVGTPLQLLALESQDWRPPPPSKTDLDGSRSGSGGLFVAGHAACAKQMSPCIGNYLHIKMYSFVTYALSQM